MAENKRVERVGLGCGTLILIALIVLIFGGGNLSGVKHDVDNLTTEVRNLKSSVDSQTIQLRLIEEKLDKLQPVEAK